MHGAADRALLREIAELMASGQRVVLVHGGGPEIDRALAERAIATRRVDGLRVTDEHVLKVTEAVLSGTVNKALVRSCYALGIPAVGLCGQDGAVLVCQPERASLGYVGKVVRVNCGALESLTSAGFLPVLAPLGIAADGSTAYNVNADTAAGAIAAALGADALLLVTDVARVLRDWRDPASGIDRMTVAQAARFHDSTACRQSMKPKVAAALAAARAGAASYICAPGERTIAAALAGNATRIAG